MKKYSCVLLDDDSRKLLIDKVKNNIPENWKIIAHHMTIKLGEINDKRELGKRINLNVEELGLSKKAMAVKVSGYHSKNKIPHITIAINRDGGKPIMSNKIKKWIQIKNFTISGIVSEINTDRDVKILGIRPSPSTPAVIFISGLGEEDEDKIWQWNLDKKIGKDPHIAYGFGVQKQVSEYTITMSFNWNCIIKNKYPLNVKDEVKLILDLAIKNNIKPPYIMVGHSMGGKPALMARTMYPKEIVAVVVIDSAPWSYLKSDNAMPDKEYIKNYPTAASRIISAINSMNNNDFDIEGFRKDKKIHFHVDIAPLDAPIQIQEKTRERAKENEKDFYNVVRHYGAGHDIMVKDPRTIIADILRYIKL